VRANPQYKDTMKDGRPAGNGQDSEAISWHVRDRRRPDGRGWTQTTSRTGRRHHDKQTPSRTSRQRDGQANVEERN
jgi:hypothetical protein